MGFLWPVSGFPILLPAEPDDSEGPPFEFFGTVRLFSNFFVSKRHLPRFLSLRYSADLGRSRLVYSSTSSMGDIGMMEDQMAGTYSDVVDVSDESALVLLVEVLEFVLQAVVVGLQLLVLLSALVQLARRLRHLLLRSSRGLARVVQILRQRLPTHSSDIIESNMRQISILV